MAARYGRTLAAHGAGDLRRTHGTRRFAAWLPDRCLAGADGQGRVSARGMMAAKLRSFSIRDRTGLDPILAGIEGARDDHASVWEPCDDVQPAAHRLDAGAKTGQAGYVHVGAPLQPGESRLAQVQGFADGLPGHGPDLPKLMKQRFRAKLSLPGLDSCPASCRQRFRQPGKGWCPAISALPLPRTFGSRLIPCSHNVADDRHDQGRTAVPRGALRPCTCHASSVPGCAVGSRRSSSVSGLSGRALRDLRLETEAKRRQHAGHRAQPEVTFFAKRPAKGIARHARFLGHVAHFARAGNRAERVNDELRVAGPLRLGDKLRLRLRGHEVFRSVKPRGLHRQFPLQAFGPCECLLPANPCCRRRAAGRCFRHASRCRPDGLARGDSVVRCRDHQDPSGRLAFPGPSGVALDFAAGLMQPFPVIRRRTSRSPRSRPRTPPPPASGSRGRAAR